MRIITTVKKGMEQMHILKVFRLHLELAAPLFSLLDDNEFLLSDFLIFYSKFSLKKDLELFHHITTTHLPCRIFFQLFKLQNLHHRFYEIEMHFKIQFFN